MLLVSEPILGTSEKEALAATIDSGWITMGDRVRTFETEFARQHGFEDAVAVSSCTAALHLILHALGIGPGDEVLVPSLTFVATVNSILYVGATPVFVDIESAECPQLSLAGCEAVCTPRTRAVILMHYAGYTAGRDAWRSFADRKGLLLIEDAAHAAGAEQVGTFGVAAAFSFYGNKNMTTAEGGMIVASDARLLDAMRQMRGHGLTTATFQRYAAKSVGYDVTMLGFNYRMDELRAAVGLTQLGRLAAWNRKRAALTRRYMDELSAGCPRVGLPFRSWQSDGHPRSAHHIMPVVLPGDVDRLAVIERLKSAGIQTSVHYPAAHRLTYYRTRYPHVALPVSEDYADRELTLPLHPGMHDGDVDHVVSALASALRDAAGTGRSPHEFPEPAEVGV